MPLAQAPIRSRRPAAHAQATPPASGPTDPGQDSNIASVDGGSHPSERRRPHPHLTVDGMAQPGNKFSSRKLQSL